MNPIVAISLAVGSAGIQLVTAGEDGNDTITAETARPQVTHCR